MNQEIEQTSGNRKRTGRMILLIFAGLILISAVYGSLRRTFSRFSRDFLSPFLKTVTLTEEGAARSAQMMKPKRKLAGEVHVLQRKNLVLESRLKILGRVEEENRLLRSLLKLPEKKGYSPVIAEISGRTAPLWQEQFVINQGKVDGVAVGNAVAAPDHSGSLVMVGRVTEVSAGTAVVATVFSADCKLSVIVESDGSAGGMEVLQNRSNPVVKYLPPDGDYRNHGKVLTSGIADGTPGGIPVAEILPRENESAPAIIRDQLYAELNVKPLVRIDSVRTVVVFTVKDRKRK